MIESPRLGAYTDYVFRTTDEGIGADRAFAVFLGGLLPHLGNLTVIGRLDPVPGEAHYQLPPDARFVALPYYRSLLHLRSALPKLLRALLTFWRTLETLDAVWILGPHGLAIPFVLLALLRGKRVILGVRQDLPSYVRSRHPGRTLVYAAALLLEHAFRLLGRFLPVVVVGPDLAANYRRCPRLLPVMVSLMPEAALADEHEAVSRAARAPRSILSVGRLEEEKNPLLLPGVLATLADDDWELTICGEGPLRAEVQDESARARVAARTHFVGYVPLDQLLPMYRESDVFLHVSWTEGFPQVLVEAFACGVPVVATDVGGVRAGVSEAALLIPPGDATAAAAALTRIRSDAELRADLVRAGLAVAREHTFEHETGRLAAFLVTGQQPEGADR